MNPESILKIEACFNKIVSIDKIKAAHHGRLSMTLL
jgi:hypothetical protein